MSYDVEQAIEVESRARQARVKALLIERGRPDLADDLDDRLRDVRLGITWARSAWHSISLAQRRAAESLFAGDQPACRFGTIRALAAHKLLSCDPATDKLSLTERGRFMMTHGRPPPPTGG